VFCDGGDGNDVVLTLINSGISFCSVANTRNQCHVALALDQFPTDNALFQAVLLQSPEGAREAFDALSGEVHASVSGVLADESRYVRDAMLGRLTQASYTGRSGQVASLGAGGPQVAALDAQAMTVGSDEPMTVGYDDKSLAAPQSYGPALVFWTNAFGAWADFDGNKNAASADRNLGGFVSGMDAHVAGSWRLGLATGASFSDISVDARHSGADVDSFHLGGYAGGAAGPLALRGGGAWTWNDIDTSRAVIFPGFFEREKASYGAGTGQIFGEVAYPTAMGAIALEPFADIAGVSIDTDSFKEHGGALSALRGRSVDEDVGYSTVGLRLGTIWHWRDMVVVPHASAAWGLRRRDA
jgi:outer membrane autotransporter protein